MVYVKKVYEDGTEIKVPLDDDGTVFTNCPFCGKEMGIGLAELADDDLVFDFSATQILCDKCSNLYTHYTNYRKEDET